MSAPLKAVYGINTHDLYCETLGGPVATGIMNAVDNHISTLSYLKDYVYNNTEIINITGLTNYYTKNAVYIQDEAQTVFYPIASCTQN